MSPRTFPGNDSFKVGHNAITGVFTNMTGFASTVN